LTGLNKKVGFRNRTSLHTCVR